MWCRVFASGVECLCVWSASGVECLCVWCRVFLRLVSSVFASGVECLCDTLCTDLETFFPLPSVPNKINNIFPV